MRHRIKGRTFGRYSGHRKALLNNLLLALLQNERITTTTAKAKELRSVADRLVTLGKRGDLHARRRAYSQLGSHDMVKHLFDEVAPRFSKRPGGYTRIYKLAKSRHGDNAELSFIEFVERGTPYSPAKKQVVKKPTGKKETKRKVVEEEKTEKPKKERFSLFRRKSKDSEVKQESRTVSEEKQVVRQDADSRSRKIHRKPSKKS